MKKFFMAMMAIAAIAFVGCKPQNEPENNKGDEGDQKPEVTCTDVKVYYDVKFTGKMTDYVKLNMRYIEIPDSNNIAVKENIVADWKSEEYTVQKGSTLFLGVEPSVRVTELFKQTFTDEAKHKTMVESNSSFVVAVVYEKYLSNSTVLVEYAYRDTLPLSDMPFGASEKDAAITVAESRRPGATKLTWDDVNGVVLDSVDKFWDRH